MKMEPCGDDLTPTTAKIVFVEWEDIQSHEDWNEESEGNTTCSLKSIGWLIEDDDRKLVIAATYDHENERWANKFAIGKLPPEVTALTVTEMTRALTYKDAVSFENLIKEQPPFDMCKPKREFGHVPRSADNYIPADTEADIRRFQDGNSSMPRPAFHNPSGHCPIDEATEEERRALNPNRVVADQFHKDMIVSYTIPGQP